MSYSLISAIVVQGLVSEVDHSLHMQTRFHLTLTTIPSYD
jgi:hypothetical protein